MVEANQRPFGDQLPDCPPLDLEQGDNILLNPPYQPLDLPVGEENQQHQIEEPRQVPNLPPNQPPNPVQNLPAPMANPHQLNWSYFKPKFSGKNQWKMQKNIFSGPMTGWRHTISQMTKR